MEKCFILIFPSHVRFQLGHRTRVVVHAPVVKDEWDEDGVGV